MCCGAEKASLTLDTENVGKWFKSYQYTDPIVSIVQQSKSMEMRPADAHCIANVFCVSNDEQPISVGMRSIADGVVLIKDGDRIICLGIGPAAFKLGDAQMEVDAKQFMLGRDALAVDGATRVRWRGSLVSSDRPVSVEKSLSDGQRARAADLRKAWGAASRPEKAPPPELTAKTEGMGVKWTARLGAAVLDIAQGDVDGDGQPEIAVGCDDGRTRLLNDAGEQLWEFKAGGKINSVAIEDIDGDGKGEIIAGSDDRCCYVLNSDGTERWHYQGAAGHDPYWRRYWKAGEVEKVLAADVNGDGRKEIIFAAANMHIHACDVMGNLLWRFKQYGVCTSILAADVTGDGRMEVIGGPAKITCYSNCHVIDEKGKSISRYGNDGWASALTAVCAGDLDSDGAPEVICGTNMNNIYALNASSGKLARRWKYTAGDVINSLCTARLKHGKERHVIGGSASEYVYALTPDGKVAWTTNLHDTVRQVAARDLDDDGCDEIVASTSRALHVLDAKGRVVGSFATRSPISCFDLGQKLFLGTQEGKVRELTMVR